MKYEFHSDFRFAQVVCFFFLQNGNEDVRANAVLGLGALNIGRLKALLTQQQSFSSENAERVKYALEDISLFLNEDIEME